MLRWLSIFCATLTIVLGASAQATFAEKRVALVIGNGGYTNVASLPNPPNDARLMAKTLENLNFKVIVAIDKDKTGMERAIIDFGRQLRAAGKDAVGLFYYAGHGVQSNGVNYLLPLNLDVRDESELELSAVSASWILRQMENAGNPLNMVFLDSCRDNPFKGAKFRGAASQRGLARMVAPTGSYIGYATAPDERAADGEGRNSPFTNALTKAIQEPGLTVEQAFKRVRLEVLERTGNQQTPWDSSSLTGDFYFAGRVNSAAGPQVAAPVDADTEFWRSVERSASKEAYEAYLSSFPSGKYVSLARVKLREMDQTQVAVGTFTQLEYAPGVKFRDCPDCPEMIVVPGGSFNMGSSDGNLNEKPVHLVTIPDGLAVGVYEVTQREWRLFMGDEPSHFKGNNRPVEQVSWKDVQKFLHALNRKTGKQYRLLSESEWEYVARAGTRTKYSCGNDEDCLSSMAWYDSNSENETQFVGSKQANAFGVYDMHGNVWEWVEDCWNDNYTGAPANGSARTIGYCSTRVLRGGSWNSGPGNLRSANRVRKFSSYRIDLGLRVARHVSKF